MQTREREGRLIHSQIWNEQKISGEECLFSMRVSQKRSEQDNNEEKR